MPSASLINPPSELYLDGLDCYQRSLSEANPYMKWRYSRLSTLAFYASLEATISIHRPTASSASVAARWQNEFTLSGPNSEQAEWNKFIKMKTIRRSISHYDGSSRNGTNNMYHELTDNIDDIADITRYMLLKFYSEPVISNWEAHIIPNAG